MVMYTEVEVWILTFLFSAIDRDYYSKHAQPFYPRGQSPVPKGWETDWTSESVKMLWARENLCRYLELYIVYCLLYGLECSHCSELSGSNRHVQEV